MLEDALCSPSWISLRALTCRQAAPDLGDSRLAQRKHFLKAMLQNKGYMRYPGLPKALEQGTASLNHIGVPIGISEKCFLIAGFWSSGYMLYSVEEGKLYVFATSSLWPNPEDPDIVPGWR